MSMAVSANNDVSAFLCSWRGGNQSGSTKATMKSEICRRKQPSVSAMAYSASQWLNMASNVAIALAYQWRNGEEMAKAWPMAIENQQRKLKAASALRRIGNNINQPSAMA
jgi:hypothetical protein